MSKSQSKPYVRMTRCGSGWIIQLVFMAGGFIRNQIYLDEDLALSLANNLAKELGLEVKVKEQGYECNRR